MSTLQDSAHESDASTPQEKQNAHQYEMDTWRGWVVVAAASSSLFVYMGVIYSWGILQAQLAQQESLSLTSLTFVGSLATSCMCSLCIPVGKVVRRFGYQKTAMAGALFLGLGEFLSSWVTHSLGALFVTHGIIFGIGGGLTILVRPLLPLGSNAPYFSQFNSEYLIALLNCATQMVR